jgi:hypothetical protein
MYSQSLKLFLDLLAINGEEVVVSLDLLGVRYKAGLPLWVLGQS